MKSTVEVDRETLRQILTAITSDDLNLLMELRASMSDLSSPVMKVIRDFNSSVAYNAITAGLFGGEE